MECLLLNIAVCGCVYCAMCVCWCEFEATFMFFFFFPPCQMILTVVEHTQCCTVVGCCPSVGFPSADPATSEHPLPLPLSDLQGTAVLQQLVVSASGSIYFPQPIKLPLASACCNCADHRTCCWKKNAPAARESRRKKKKELKSNGLAVGCTELLKPQWGL